jgi:hypothetical protein
MRAKPISPSCSDPIVTEIEVSQRSMLPQQSCKIPCPCITDPIVIEIEVS